MTNENTNAAPPWLSEVDLPYAEDMAHSALQEALSFGLSHQVVHKWMRHIQDETVKAMLAAAPKAEDAANYRWLRDNNDWHAEPRIDAADGTVWTLTFYSPATIEDATDDSNLDVAITAARTQGVSHDQ